MSIVKEKRNRPLWVSLVLLLSLLSIVVAGASLSGREKIFSEAVVGITPSRAAVSGDTTTGCVSPEHRADGKILINVPYISQEGTLPTGCEIVSSTMLLRYYGINTTAEELALRIPRREVRWENGMRTGPHPAEMFAGNPFASASYGCYAPVIAELLNRELENSDLQASAVTGADLNDLINEQVAQGRPVLIWATMDMKASVSGDSWTLDDGSTFTWRKNEHCLVLVGADEQGYYFNDPYQGNGLVHYDRTLVEKRYAELGWQAVVVA
ncbi:MAG: C39 family peptidase [Clostridiales bacterium]|jgi:uncharacterized protein YvpB|nr:C39 family peptidase [Clostridiales bacterium]